MSAKNDITGDAIASKANSKSYRDNYENIFAKKATEKKVELDGGICNSKSNDGCRESKLREHVEGARVQGQAEQEQAVAWIYEKPLADGFSERTLSFGYEPIFDGVITPLYAHPPKRKPLSENELFSLINPLCEKYGAFFSCDNFDIEVVRAIEKAHGIGD